MVMPDMTNFVIPVLELEEIINCLREGVLGEIAMDILPEHLKNPTPAVMMQLCLSMLNKMGIEISTLCQPRLSSSMVLKHPDTYTNTFKLIHIFIIIKKTVPLFGNQLALTDLTTPRWKKVEKFVSACINYFKSWDGNNEVWEEIYSASAAAEDEYRVLTEETSCNEDKISELKSYNEEHRPKRQELGEKNAKLELEVEECHKRKAEKELVKDSLKKQYSEVATFYDKKAKYIDKLKEEKEDLLTKVVSSPKRHMERKQAISQKVKISEEKQIEAQERLREAERVISVMETMAQTVADAVQTAKDNKNLKENKKKIESEKQAQSYEIDNNKLAVMEDTQEFTHLKQQSATLREKMSRMALRAKQRNSEYTSTMTNLAREKETLRSQAGEIHEEVIKEEAEIRSLRNKFKEVASNHEKVVKDISDKKQGLISAIDSYSMRVAKQLVNCKVNHIMKEMDNS
uniref:kinetochore protein Nuf2-like n=1 Tax=Styela clava TaxID=7725 RepID=UPI0019393269|nr:kinetochore protein Nuf2-like [Styela clava]